MKYLRNKMNYLIGNIDRNIGRIEVWKHKRINVMQRLSVL